MEGRILTVAVDGMERLVGVGEHRGTPRGSSIVACALTVDGVSPREGKQAYRGVMSCKGIGRKSDRVFGVRMYCKGICRNNETRKLNL